MITDAMIIRRPAPEEPPIIATIRLGAIAMVRVMRFCCHFFIFMFKNPCLKSSIINNFHNFIKSSKHSFVKLNEIVVLIRQFFLPA
jgi:hypothetical protein